jgi:hypothetical protein
MKRIFIILTLTVVAATSFAGELTLPLDRCLVVNTNDDLTAPTKLVLEFAIPEMLIGKEILIAEFTGGFSLSGKLPNSNIEFRLWPLMERLPQNGWDYYSLDNLSDSLSAGSWISPLTELTSFRVFITDYMREVSLAERNHYGFVATINAIGETQVQLPNNIGEFIIGHSAIRVIYK